MLVQFVNYIGDILPFLGGNGIYFGFSYQNQAEVLPEILDRLPATIFLTVGAVILWLSIGISIGILSAVKTGTWMDRLAMSIALLFISAPVYFLGLRRDVHVLDEIGKFPIFQATRHYATRGGVFARRRR